MIIETKPFDAAEYLGTVARARGMSELEDRALRVAEQAHRGQVDKAGAPYIEHLVRVRDKLAAMFPDASEEQKAAALLHDIIEDAGWNWDQVEAVFGPRVANAVVAVSKAEGCKGEYLDVIALICVEGGEDAIRVKLADNADNLDPNRPTIAGGAEMAEKKYRPARQMLLDTLHGNASTALRHISQAAGELPALTAAGWV